MRPNGITDLTLSSFMKKYKNKKFAAGCNRDIIASGCAMLGKDVKEIAEVCIEGMKAHAGELQLLGTGEAQ
jgi:predicted hydrolase (HD superfamily)